MTGEFYTKAFSDAEKAQIMYTEIPNDAHSTGNEENMFAGEATQDYVFIPSVVDLTNEYFGLNTDANAQDTARKWEVTDYAKAAGVTTWTEEFAGLVSSSLPWDAMSFIGTAGDVWTRSPAPARGAGDDMYAVFLGMVKGSVDYYAAVDAAFIGVAPALVIVR